MLFYINVTVCRRPLGYYKKEEKIERKWNLNQNSSLTTVALPEIGIARFSVGYRYFVDSCHVMNVMHIKVNWTRNDLPVKHIDQERTLACKQTRRA